jgi:hypothetical protein
VLVYTGGVGHHLAEVERDNPGLIVGWAKGIFAIELMHPTSVLLPKLSALYFYLRIFTSRTSRILAYFTIALVASNWGAFVIAVFLQCRPLAYWWDRTVPGGNCFNVQALYRAMCVPNIVTDLIVMALPISSIMELKLPIFRKIALTTIFLTASALVHSHRISF